MKSHLYLFTIDDGGNPEIWFTEQNQGNDANKLHFRPTENQALRDKFFMLIKQSNQPFLAQLVVGQLPCIETRAPV